MRKNILYECVLACVCAIMHASVQVRAELCDCACLAYVTCAHYYTKSILDFALFSTDVHPVTIRPEAFTRFALASMLECYKNGSLFVSRSGWPNTRNRYCSYLRAYAPFQCCRLMSRCDVIFGLVPSRPESTRVIQRYRFSNINTS